MSTQREIRLIENEDGWWTAEDIDTGLVAEAETREEALTTLDDVVEAAAGEGGHEPTDEELEALEVDPDIAQTQGDELPEVLSSANKQSDE